MIPFLNTGSGTNISAGIQESVELIRKFAEKDGSVFHLHNLAMKP